MKKQTGQWIVMARYDLKTAEHMFNTRRYVYVIFLCHLTVEKLLKGAITEFTDTYPPKIHILTTLADKAGIQFPDTLTSFVSEMSEQSIVTRYPEDIRAYKRAEAQHCLKQTHRVVKWLEQRLKSGN